MAMTNPYEERFYAWDAGYQAGLEDGDMQPATYDMAIAWLKHEHAILSNRVLASSAEVNALHELERCIPALAAIYER